MRSSSAQAAPVEGSSMEEVSTEKPEEGSFLGEAYPPKRPTKSSRKTCGGRFYVEEVPFKFSTRTAPAEGLCSGEGSAEPTKMEPQDEEAKQKVRQGVWDETETTMLPEAYELLEEDPEAVSGPGKFFPSKCNDELIENANRTLMRTLLSGKGPQFSALRAEKLDRESRSPTRLLTHQTHGGPHGGFYTMMSAVATASSTSSFGT